MPQPAPNPPPVTQVPLGPSGPITGSPPPSIGASVQPRAAALQPPKSPQEQQTLTAKWLEFLRKPEVQAGLLQFSINAMQPVQPGQTELGHIGAAVAGGGEAIGRVRGARREQAETARKAGLEERKVGAEEERVNVLREGVVSRAGTAKADREARKLVAEGKDTAAMARLERDIATRLDISKGTNRATVLSNLLKEKFRTFREAVDVDGNPIGAPPTVAGILSDFIPLDNVLAGRAPISEEQVTDEQLVEGLTHDDPQVRAQAEEVFGLTPPARQRRIESQVEAAEAAKPKDVDETEAPKPKKSARERRLDELLPERTAGPTIPARIRATKLKRAQAAVADVQLLEGEGLSREKAIRRVLRFGASRAEPIDEKLLRKILEEE